MADAAGLKLIADAAELKLIGEAFEYVEENAEKMGSGIYNTLLMGLMRLHESKPKDPVLQWDDPLMAPFLAVPYVEAPIITPQCHTKFRVQYGGTTVMLFHQTYTDTEGIGTMKVSMTERQRAKHDNTTVYHYRIYTKTGESWSLKDWIINPITGIVIGFKGDTAKKILRERGVNWQELASCLQDPANITMLIPRAEQVQEQAQEQHVPIVRARVVARAVHRVTSN